jgi:rhodanese-related sulfurtransferase
MMDADEKFLLVVVREPAEWEIVRLPGAVLIPKGDVPSKLAELPQDRPVIAYCKTGIRSAEVLALLKNAGFADAKHVQGGISAWATQVEKAQPVY